MLLAPNEEILSLDSAHLTKAVWLVSVKIFSVSSLRHWAASRCQLKFETSGGGGGVPMEPLSSVNFLPERLSPYCIISYNFAAAASATRPTFDQSLSPIGKYLSCDLQIRQDCGFLWHKCRNQTPLGEHSCFEGFGKTASSFSFASLLINIFVWTFSSVLL